MCYVSVMQSDRAKVAILKALHEIDAPAGASRVGARLLAAGIDLRPRTIRLYLLELDQAGLTKLVSRRRGRALTPRGVEELSHSNVMEKVGFVAAKVDTLGYQMSFKNTTGRGTVIANRAVIGSTDLDRALTAMEPVFRSHLSMGSRLAIMRGGATSGSFTVPDDGVAVVTVCSVTVNGIMLHAGIPIRSRFGGLLEMKSGRPARFVELMEYRGTTLDPLEVFIKADMTSVGDCARTGSGIIGASFREVPTVAIDGVRRIRRRMERRGLGAILAIGDPNQPLMDIPVDEGHCGIIVVGGLNPVAGMHEAGIDVSLQSLAGLCDIDAFSDYQAVYRRQRMKSQRRRRERISDYL